MYRWLIPTTAAWLPAAAWAGPGDHLRAGPVEVTPSVEVGAEYRTNVYRSEEDAIPAANLRVAPSLRLSRSTEANELRFEGEWELRKYFYQGQSETLPTSLDPSPANLDRFDEFSVLGGVDVFKKSPIGLRLQDDLRLVNFRADAEYADIPYSSNLRNHLSGAVRLNPGQALEIAPGGMWTYDSYRIPSVNGSDRSLNGRNIYGPIVDVKWSFFPRTALVASFESVYVRWDVNALSGVSDVGIGAGVALPDSRQTKGNVGVDGRLTERISAQVFVGYGEAIFDGSTTTASTGAAAGARGWDGVSLRTQVKYAITPDTEQQRGTSVTAGYVRDFEPALFTNFAQIDKVFVDATARIRALEPNLRFERRFEDYVGDISRQDIVDRATANLRVNVTDWAAFTTGAWWQKRGSTDAVVEYSDFALHALATLAY